MSFKRCEDCGDPLAYGKHVCQVDRYVAFQAELVYGEFVDFTRTNLGRFEQYVAERIPGRLADWMRGGA